MNQSIGTILKTGNVTDDLVADYFQHVLWRQEARDKFTTALDEFGKSGDTPSKDYWHIALTNARSLKLIHNKAMSNLRDQLVTLGYPVDELPI